MMKRLITLTIMVVTMVANADTTSVTVVELKPAQRHTPAAVAHTLDDAMLAKVLKAIAQVESGGRDVEVHADGISHGRYGITMMACRELLRIGKLSAVPDPEDLDVPETCERLARLYLIALYQDDARGGQSWWLTVCYYHGGNRTDREAYAAKVWGCL